MKKVLLVLFVSLILVGCNEADESNKKGGETAREEQQAVQTGFNRLSKSQQVPSFDWSQERQTLLDVEAIRATGSSSTTVGYLEGVGMVWWCPSIGSPVPSTYQLSGTTQWVDLPGDESRELFAIDQGEPTGVYVGSSNATWVVCLDDNGKKFGKYWEGPVDSTIGVVPGLPDDLRVRVSDITFEFTEKPK